MMSETTTVVAESESGDAGIRIHEEDGVSKDGVEVPAGTVEVYGLKVEFSHTGEHEGG